MLNDKPFEASPDTYFPRAFSVDHLLWQNLWAGRTTEELARDLAESVRKSQERRGAALAADAWKILSSEKAADDMARDLEKTVKESRVGRDTSLAAAAARRLGEPVEGFNEGELAQSDDRSLAESLVIVGHMIGLSGAWVPPPESDLFWAAAAAITKQHGVDHPNDIPVSIHLDQVPGNQP